MYEWHLFTNKYLTSSYYVSDTVLVMGLSAVEGKNRPRHQGL